MSHSRSSLLDLPHISFTQHSLPLDFFHLAVTVNHLIHGQQDRLVVWPHTVRSQVMSPTTSSRSEIQRSFLFTDHGEDVTSPVSSGRPASPVLVQETEGRSKCNPCENSSLWKRKFYVTLIPYSKHGGTCCHTLTQTEIEQRRKKRTRETSHKWKNSIWTTSKRFPENSEQMALTKENKKPYQDSLKRNFAQDHFLKSKEIKFSQRQIWDTYAGVNGGTCRRCHPSVEQTKSCPAHGNLP